MMQLHNLLTSKGEKSKIVKSGSTVEAPKLNKKSKSKPLSIDKSASLVKEIQAMIIS